MAALRSAPRLLTRRSIVSVTCRCTAQSLSKQPWLSRTTIPKAVAVAPSWRDQLRARQFSGSARPLDEKSSRIYIFDEVKKMVSDPQEDRILIDVREPSEFAAGHIPSALNVPITSNPDALFLPPEEFEDRFGFEKPDTKDAEVVFYCKSGVRSGAAAKFALQSGYESVGEYKGSWLDWDKRGGPREP